MKLSKITSRITTYLKFLRYGERIRPVRDWLVVLAVVAVLIISTSIWSYGLFRQTTAAERSQATAAAQASISRASLETVRNIFEARAAEHERYLSEYHFVDPSR